jgi:two-component system sensor histidine kinase MprB
MSFRARLALVAATAVALAIVAASFAVYFVVKQELRGPIDDSLRHSAVELQHTPPDDIPRGLFHLTAQLGGAPGYPQVVKADGQAIPIAPGPMLPVDGHDIEVAQGNAGAFLRDAHVSNTHVRMITFPIGGVAVQVVRPLTEVDHSLARIETWLILIAGGGIAIAAGLGLLVARAALAPVRRLTCLSASTSPAATSSHASP